MSYSLTRKQPILPHERNRFSAKLRSILPCTYGHSCKQKHFGQGEGGEIGRRVRTGCQSTDRFVCNTSGNCCRLELVPSQCLALFSTQNEQRAKNPKATFVQTRIEDDMSIHARKIIFKNNTYYQATELFIPNHIWHYSRGSTAEERCTQDHPRAKSIS